MITMTILIAALNISLGCAVGYFLSVRCRKERELDELRSKFNKFDRWNLED